MKIITEVEANLLKRVFFSCGILLLIRIGTFIPIPVIDHELLAKFIQTDSTVKALVSTFSDKSTFVVGLFTLNIFPYINASILVQLILAFSPKLAKLQKEGDLEGRRSINRLSRFITLIISIIQSLSITTYLKPLVSNWNYILGFEVVMWLTTGAMIVFLFSELITDYGFGNGIQLIIYSNIISNLQNIYNRLMTDNTENLTPFSVSVLVLLIFLALYGIVCLQGGEKLIPLISSKQLNKSSVKDVDNYLPLRFNQAGIMPVILTTSILVIPGYSNSLGLLPQTNFKINFESLNFFYWIADFLLILIFSSFYSKIVLNPKDISDQLQRMSVTIPGIRPGIQTTFYLQQLMDRLTLVGSIMLATLVTVPNFIESKLNLVTLNGLTTTSLVILAGILLELFREFNNIYFSNIYTKMSK